MDSRIAQFWAWFQAGPATWTEVVHAVFDEERSVEITDAFERYFPESQRPDYPAGILLQYHEGEKKSCQLVFSLIFNRDDESRRQLAPLIEEIVGAAPELSHWQFRAFAEKVGWQDAYLPRLELPEGPLLKIAPLRFLVLREEPLALCIYAPSYADGKKRAFQIGIERILEAGMGERWVLKSLKSLELRDAADAPESALPLRELSKRFPA